jgi:hypothetical protein
MPPTARSGLTGWTCFPSFAPSTTNNKNNDQMKTKRTRSLEPAVVTIGQVCFLLLTMIVVPF